MQVSNLYKEINHPKDGYSIKLLMPDNLKICRRKDWNQTKFDSCVYIFYRKSDKITKLGWNIEINGDPYYFGFTKNFILSSELNNRPFKHFGDLLSKLLSNEWECACILGLSEIEAHCLEALLIKQSNKPLSEYGATTLEEGCLINKRRERKYEHLIDEYLNIETQWK